MFINFYPNTREQHLAIARLLRSRWQLCSAGLHRISGGLDQCEQRRYGFGFAVSADGRLEVTKSSNLNAVTAANEQAVNRKGA